MMAEDVAMASRGGTHGLSQTLFEEQPKECASDVPNELCSRYWTFFEAS